jgi:hypothetical protein
MTAIVLVHNQDGFFIAADGRLVEKGIVVSDTQQKIFQFDDAHLHIAFAWTGVTQTEEYNLPYISKFALRGAAKSSNFCGFIDRLVSEINNHLPPQMSNTPAEIARMALVGYYREKPCFAEIIVRYENDILTPSVVTQIPANLCRRIFVGAESVFSKWMADDLPYKRDQAINFSTGYIQDCINSANLDCANIGGMLHAAELTPSGFSWIIPPK